MPAMIVWPVSSSRLTRKVGSSSASRWIAVPSFSWSALVFGSIATWMTGSGKVIDSRMTGACGSQSVSPVVVSFSPITAKMWPDQGLVDRVLLVGVHLEDLADALLAVLGRVDDLGARGEPARVDPDVGELAEVRVRCDLERQRGERLVLAGRAAGRGLPVRQRALDRRHVHGEGR